MILRIVWPEQHSTADKTTTTFGAQITQQFNVSLNSAGLETGGIIRQ